MRVSIDFRLFLIVAALLLLLAALLRPQWSMMRTGFDFLAVVDVTGSMNVRDYKDGERPVSRLDAVKKALREMAAGLPCPSRLALGVFAERQSFLLFEPIDVCADYASIDSAIAALDWRMAWEGDSRVAAGLFRAIDMANGLNADLLFFTDGQEAPPLPASGGPEFTGRRGAVRGVIIGVGGYELSPIPKFDDKGREVGFFGPDDVPHESRFGLPPKGAEQREGFNARNAPFGATIAIGEEHLSAVREPYLQGLADSTGLAYAHFTRPEALLTDYRAAGTSRARHATLDLSSYLATLAAAALAGLYLAPLSNASFSALSKWIATSRKSNRGDKNEKNSRSSSRYVVRNIGLRARPNADQGQ